MFKDINLQNLAWIIVKPRPGLLYASLLISQSGARMQSRRITVGDLFGQRQEALVLAQASRFVPANRC